MKLSEDTLDALIAAIKEFVMAAVNVADCLYAILEN